jgi:hypothetical protein
LEHGKVASDVAKNVTPKVVSLWADT